MEQKDVVDEKVTLKIHGKEREIRFTFSAWAKLEEEYGGVKNFVKMQEQIQERPFKYLPHLLYLGLLDKEGVTEEDVLDDYSLRDIELISDVFNRALSNAMPVAEKKTVVPKK
jgi:hypothetical protein